ncbi:MAG TPA: glycosyltransferase [Fibrobacteria bacterium]|nr:glycosyltransferase [Fibrobacteria bacterium]
MRIAAISHVFPNAVDRTFGLFVFERLSGMRKSAEVTVIAPLPWLPLPARLGPHGRLRGVPLRATARNLDVVHPRFLSIPGLHTISAICFALRLLLGRTTRRCLSEADVLDAHWTFPDGFAAWLVAKVLRKPYFITIRGDEAFYAGQGWLRGKLLTMALRGAAGIISVSEDLRRKTLARTGLPPGRVTTIVNGVDTELFAPMDRAEARKALGLPQDRILVLSVGFLSERKGYHKLVEAWPRLLRDFPSAELVIVGGKGAEGKASYAGRLERAIEALGLGGSVRMVGGKGPRDLVAWYAAANLYCLASSGEGCPNVVLEALACGRPVLGTAVGGVPDLIDRPELGLLFSPDFEDFHEKMKAALSLTWSPEAIRKRMEGRSWDGCGAAHAERLAHP